MDMKITLIEFGRAPLMYLGFLLLCASGLFILLHELSQGKEVLIYARDEDDPRETL